MTIGALITGVLFIFIQLFANRLIPSSRIRRGRWLSFSGGIAVSYVFVYVLPALHEQQAVYGEEGSQLTMESELYFVGLIGVLVLFGIKKIADNAEQKTYRLSNVFWVELGFFSIYNMLISYVVITSQVAGWQAVFYSTAIGTHFLAVSYDLWSEDADRYRKVGRYLLAVAILIGWIVGLWITLPSLIVAIIFAFISGAMILNVLKEELPSKRKTHFPSFVLGSVSYTFIVIALKYFFEW
ncbi:hypothetical protein QA612_10395 [Evansella sp. AB-P1]|uniref:hypothetical protein n=1 Tax=Evansella sp. AB-P1 TaxID=3037653 RepID=UPI00241D5B6C|nr:hypothetical protein [Evansella sp. AB-P1]MDG5787908.1 hypothetical protein [Evansella sp. AB-P1]